MVRSLIALAAVAPSALALNSRLIALESETIEQRMELAVQLRQYAMHMSREESMEDVQKPSTLLAHGSTAANLGKAASLTEDGYKSVARLGNQEAMQAYAEKLLAEDGLHVKDAGMLQRVMPFYSGECATQSLVALRRELHEATVPHGCHAAWVGKKESSAKKSLSLLARKPRAAVHPLKGDEAPLDESGYLAVVALKDNSEMKKFIRRTAKAHGLEIMNQGGLSGFARYYSGVCASQSFAALVNELRSVQSAVRTTSVSYNAPAEEAVDEHKITERIAAATGLTKAQIHVKTGTSKLPNATQVKQLVATESGVEEDRVTVLQASEKKVLFQEVQKHGAKNASKANSATAVKVEAHKPEAKAHKPEAKDASAEPAHKQEAAKAPHASSPEAVKARALNAAVAHKSEIEKPTLASHPKSVKSFVVTVTTDMHDAPVEDILKGLTSKMELKVNGSPITMVASVAQSQKCGGGWVAPDVSQ
eukprot:TRINITY_DN75_c0_g3_i2.p1 TRINITY_DN75_c0_g3~~TRINITY_DN75_c0_g3_i2.p1  ORF type:complete len:478 (-),score=102.82 TRINITY_DN75_c0_g3_i2:136-1569(-)